MSVTLSGFFSGLDTSSIIAQLIAIDSIPITNLETEKDSLSEESSALGFIKSSLSTLQTKLTALNDTSSLRALTASSSSTSVGTASVDSSVGNAGSVKIEITQMATSSYLNSGGTKATDVPAGTALAQDVFGTGVLGYFTINNTQITITATTTINDIVTAMEAVPTMDAGTTEYNGTTGKFTLGTTGSLILGSSGDTSDFLQQAQLFNSNVAAGGPGYTVTSSLGVGRMDTSATLGSITNFGGIAGSISGNGVMTINGVAISYSTTDTLETFLANITSSDAGVVATYDSYADQFVLTSKTRGSQGISVVDTTGNLADAMQLRTGTDATVVLGDSTQFRVNDGAVRESADSTLSAEELGVTGLTFNPISTGTTTVTVDADTASVKTLIDDFITQYNSVQSMIESYTVIDTDDTSNNGILASDSTVSFLASGLRQIVMGSLNDTDSTYQMLEDLGITGNDNDNTITVSDSSKLEDALNNHLDEVISMFTDSTSGLYTKLSTFLDSYASDTNGIIQTRQDSITNQEKWIDDQISVLQLQIDAETEYLTNAFAAMEAATAQSQTLLQYFTNSSS